MKPREVMLIWLTCVVALIGGTILALKPEYDAWTARRKLKEAVLAQIAKSEQILAQKPQVEKRLAELRKSVRPMPAGQTPANVLARKINDLAAKNGVLLSDRQTGEERSSAGLHILPVKCRWDQSNTRGLRDLLIDFLDADVILDVTELTVVSRGQDQLKGNFTVSCVFSK